MVCSLSEYKVLTQLCGENSHQKPGKTQSESQVQISGENKIPINALPEYEDLTQVCGDESHQRQQAHRHLKANMRGADERGIRNSHQDPRAAHFQESDNLSKLGQHEANQSIRSPDSWNVDNF